MSTDGPWLQQLRPTGTSPVDTAHQDRLVCWPPAGGSAGFFQPFAAALPGFDVWAVQPPGRGRRMREDPVTDPEVAVSHVLTELAALPPTDGSLVLMGHSMGSAMAHMLATRAGGTVDFVVLSAWPAPDRHAANALGKPAAELGSEDLLAFLRSVGSPGAGELATADIAEYLLPPLRADLMLGEVLATERNQERTSAPALIVFAEDDPVIAAPDVLAWQEVVDVRRWIRLTGGHFAIAGHVAEVVDGLLRLLPLESGPRGR